MPSNENRPKWTRTIMSALSGAAVTGIYAGISVTYIIVGIAAVYVLEDIIYTYSKP